MLTSPLAPYLYWAKTRPAAAIDLAGSNLLACPLEDLPGATAHVALTAPDRDGYPPLVEAIAAHYGVPSDRVATAPGCSAANFLAIAAIVAAGDTVLMESPGYDQITGACRLMGARIAPLPRRFEDGYAIDVDALRRQITPGVSLVILTRPHNPSGAVLSDEALRAVDAVAQDAGVWVLVDEVYLDATNLQGTRGAIAPPRARGRYTPAALLGRRLVSTASLTKSYGLAGLRCGWAVGPPPLVERMHRVRDLIDNIGAAPADRLSALAFSRLDALADRSRRLLSDNLTAARAWFATQASLELAVPVEATIVFPRLTARVDVDGFVARLAAERGVAVAPGRLFDAPAHLRISLGGATAPLHEGLARLGAALTAT